MIRILSYIVLFSLLASCAQVVSPTGGPKDTTPPQAIAYTPDSASLHFKADKIEIEFDEYIQLKDLNKQLIVSPPLNNKPVVKVKNKILEIQLKDTLESNTTYVINFGTAICDITENNPAADFQYLFSTGSYIDSLSITGKAQIAFNHHTDEGILVMLYKDLSDSVVNKSMPSYFAKTKKDGSYRINNIHAGTYKVFALKDKNKNFLYDAGDILIGYHDEPVSIEKNDTLDLELFAERLEKQFIKDMKVQKYGKLFLRFNLPVDRLNFTSLEGTGKKAWELIEYSAEKDSVFYWFTDVTSDSLHLEVSDNGTVIDTLHLKLLKKGESPKVKKGKKPEPFEFGYQSNLKPSFELKTPIKIAFRHPIKDYDAQKISLIKGRDSIPFKTTFTDAASRNLWIEADLLEDSTYYLFIPPNTFVDIFDLHNDTILQKLTIKSARDYGNVKLQVTLPDQEQDVVLQLLNKSQKLVREAAFKGDTLLNFEAVNPEEYILKLIYDDNANGKWDSGSYTKKIQPEKVIYYKKKMSVRANWDMDLEWKVD